MAKHFEKFAGEGINDADYEVTKFGPVGSDGKKTRLWVCPFYEKWMNLMRRTASGGCSKRGCYKSVEICEEWKTFSNFRKWMETQDWEGKVLDKDLKGTGKLYSPETCMFIPSELNLFLVGKRKSKGVSVTGITVTKGGYVVQVNGEYGGKYKCIYQAIGQRLSQQISKIRPEWEDYREAICRFFYRRAAEDVKFVRDSDKFPYFHSKPPKPVKPKPPTVEELFEERRKNREGKSFVNRKGFKYTVVEYKGTNDVLVKFEDGLEVWTTWYYAERGMTPRKIK